MGTTYCKVTLNELEALYDSIQTLEAMMGGGNSDLDAETRKSVKAMQAIFKRNGLETEEAETSGSTDFSVPNIVDVETGGAPDDN